MNLKKIIDISLKSDNYLIKQNNNYNYGTFRKGYFVNRCKWGNW